VCGFSLQSGGFVDYRRSAPGKRRVAWRIRRSAETFRDLKARGSLPMNSCTMLDS
jgi:hypothetical protein